MKYSRAVWLNTSWFFLKRILFVNLIFLAIGFLWRFAFMKTYGSSSELTALPNDVIHAFILGTRFDGTVLFHINALPLLFLFLLSLLAFIKSAKRLLNQVFIKFRNFLVPYYTIMLFLVFFISAVDFVFYSFYQDRINILIFGFLKDDTLALVKTIWRNYPLVWIFLGLISFALILFKGLKLLFYRSKEFLPQRYQKISYPTFVFFFLSVNLINGVGARGGLALFPLGEIDTGISKSIFINHLCYNGVRAFSRSLKLKSQQTSSWDSNLRHFGYGENYKKAFADFYQIPENKVPNDPLELLKQQTPKNDWAEKTKPHVLLLVMESFGGYWVRYNQPEFDLMGDLKHHFKDDTFTPNILSSTNATIGSLSNLMIGSPQRPISEFLTESNYLQVRFRSSPADTFKKSGYRTRFIYGGNPGWREINKFALRQGFDTVEGEQEIAQNLGNINERHDWGIYDEDLFDYVYKTLKEAQGPQYILGMTTTNHPPYQLPSTYKSTRMSPPDELKSRLIEDPSLADKRFQTFRYSSNKLAEFLLRVKNSTLKDNLIIAVTGDHTFWIVNFNQHQLMHKGSVPLYLYLPKAIRKKLNPETFGSHADILPTLYNLALSKQTYFTLGRDLFSNTPDFAVNSSSLILNSEGGVLVKDNAKNDAYFDWIDKYDTLVSSEPSASKKLLSTKYKSLMGILDFYFKNEKEEQKK